MDILSIPLDSLTVATDRQRKVFKGIESLAASISKIGFITPIVVEPIKDTDKYLLIAGERRYKAAQQLELATIPAVLKSNLSSQERILLELEENVKRENLTWQETVNATAKYVANQPDPDNIILKDVAEKLSLSPQHLKRILDIYQEASSGNDKIFKAETLKAALNIITRRKDRELEHAHAAIISTVFTVNEDPEEKENPFSIKSEEENPDSDPANIIKAPIFNKNFLEWAPEYSGPLFNIIHCDFPYGINHDKSDMGGAEIHGAYADSKEVYWELLSAFIKYQDKFISSSAHCIFWFSMNYYNETKEAFEAAGWFVQPNPLIWHKTDNTGIVPDVNRRPRHIYETAFFMSRGDRKIITPKADVYGAPTIKSSHISQKSIPMLKHFLSICTDDLASVFDPTCGSGGALQAAYQLGAKRILGLELNSEYADRACIDYINMVALNEANKNL